MVNLSDPMQLRAALQSSTPIKCESCQNDVFIEANYIRKISKIMTGSAEDALVPLPIFVCSKCGHVNDQFKLKLDADKKPIVDIQS